MQRENHIWITSLVDLLLLMICFFVMVFSVNLKNKEKSEDSAFDDTKAILAPAKIDNSLILMYNNLIANNSSIITEISLDEKMDKIRIISSEYIEEKENLDKKATLIGEKIFFYSKNLIKVSLLINIENLRKTCNLKNQEVTHMLKNLIEIANNFRNVLAKSANNSNIALEVEFDSNVPVSKNIDWVIVTDLMAEPS